MGEARAIQTFSAPGERIFCFSKVTADGTVILPMVLQIRETMVLQRVEREGKGSPPRF